MATATATVTPLQLQLQRRLRQDTLSLLPNSRLRNPSFPHPNPNPNPIPNRSNSRRRKGSRAVRFQSNSQNINPRKPKLISEFPAKKLAMGGVKILKRGEKLSGCDSFPVLAKNRRPRGNGGGEPASPALGTTELLGPDPETVKKQVRVRGREDQSIKDLVSYAGSAFLASPPPSSLPVPGFLGRTGK